MPNQLVEELVPTRFSQTQSKESISSEKPGSLVRIYPNQGIGKLVSLCADGTLVGRDLQAQLSIEDDSVSRRHAIIQHIEGADSVQDLESTNGTWVNDQRVTVRVLIQGDRVRFGNQIFTYLSASSLEAQYHESVYKMMTTDGLTQVYNKRYLLETLERELSRAARRRSPLCVLMMDLDKFKSINDTWGHLAGDAVLTEFSRRVGSVLQGDEVLARFGGEEFSLLVPDTSLEEATQIAENVRAAVASSPVTFEDTKIPITVSIGVAQFSADLPPSSSSLLEEADRMLYLAKTSGRNQVQSRRS